MTTVKPRQIRPLIQAILPEFTLIKCAKANDCDGFILKLARNEARTTIHTFIKFRPPMLARAIDGDEAARAFIAGYVRQSAQLAVAR